MQRHGANVAHILERLVAFDTTSHKTNIPLILYVEDYLREHGVASYLVPTDDGQKASLFATIGPDHAGGIALSGHTDVVPVDGQAWDTDPFKLTVKDDRYYGRGASDMKGFLACVLAAVPRFKAKPLAKPIHIAFSYDEEIGCLGVRPMIADLGTRLPMPRVVIVGEPTEMRVVDAHKGPVRWQVEIAGRAAHSSMAHLGVNAITYAGMILGELQHIESDLKANLQDPRFEPPYPTLQVTTIEGGTASNIVPVSCRFGFEIRSMPGLDIAAVEARLNRYIERVCMPQMRTTAPEAGITVTRKNYVPPFGSSEGSEAVALALALAGQNETFAVSYATEAGLFQDAGAPSVVCGPGSIAQAHTANEWIAASELEKCLSFMDRLADWCAA
jgi:acetylornithine deacetylase